MTSPNPEIPKSVEQLAEQFLECFRRGERPDVAEFSRQFPERSDEIRDLFAALVLMEKSGGVDRLTTGAQQDDEPEVPVTHFGRYRILREIGRGGMGIVYEAVHEHLARFAALKVLVRELADKPIFRLRFEREAQSAARLHHTNIVPVFDVGEEEGLPYYAMQLVAGRPLDAVLADFRRRNAAASPDPVSSGDQFGTPRYFRSMAQIGQRVADALAHAHEQGVVHRDIKPSNILLDEKGNTWVSDFGLAKDEFGDPNRTEDLAGTLRYMAPEQLEGRSEPCGDIYALGVSLYEMLTLHPPFNILDRTQLIQQILNEEPSRPRELEPRLPRDLEAIVVKSMAKDSGDRYATARALADDLGRYLADRPLLGVPASPIHQARQWARYNPVVAGVSAAVFGLLLGLAVFFLVASARQQILTRNWKMAATEAAAGKADAEQSARHIADDMNRARKDLRELLDLACAGPRALANSGEYTRAATEIEALLASGPLPGAVVRELANVYLTCLSGVKNNSEMLESDRQILAEKYAAQAVALLAKAGELGAFETRESISALSQDATLQPLKDREDFRKLLAELEAKVNTRTQK